MLATQRRDLPSDIPPGSYYVGWIIDTDDELYETNENNNTAYKEGYKLTVEESSGYFRIGWFTEGGELIPDMGNIAVDANCTHNCYDGTSCAPEGAIVTEVRYRMFICPFHELPFRCSDYEVHLSSDAHGGAMEYLSVYDNLGGLTDQNYDDDTQDDGDIELIWRTTHAFDGENPNQTWYTLIKDTQTGNTGCLGVFGFEIHWTLGGEPGYYEIYDLGESYRSFEPQTLKSCQSGQTLNIHFAVGNNGTEDTSPFKICFYASTDTNITETDFMIGTEETLPSIPAGQSMSFMATEEFPTDIPPGSYYIGWIMDTDDELNEGNEDNNTAYKQGYKLTVTGDEPTYSVVIDEISIEPSEPDSCDNITITVSGTDSTTCVPNNSTVSINNNVVYFDLIYDYPPGTMCGQAITGWQQIQSVGSLSPGNYIVRVRVSPYTTVYGTTQFDVESCSEDNCCGFSPGDRVVLLVDNPLDGMGNPAVDLYAGTLGTVVCCDHDDPFLPLFVSWDNWTNGKSNDYFCDPPVIDYVPNSSWWMACDQIAEADEQPDLYDLKESYRGFEPQTLESGKAGQYIDINTTIKNGGDQSSSPCLIRFYASIDTNITSSDYELTAIFQDKLPALQPNEQYDFFYSTEFPTDIPAGSYYIGWIIDAADEVSESNENNNTAYKMGYKLTVTSGGSSYNFVEEISIEPQEPNSCDNITITVSGTDSTTCVPNDSMFSIKNNIIYFDLIYDYPSGTMCGQAITEWQQMQSVGQLSSGTYTVYVRVSPYVTVYGTTQFVVDLCDEIASDNIIYVDENAAGLNNGLNWADAFNNLQDALDYVSSIHEVNEIRVAQGIYNPDNGGCETPGDRQATFRLINGVNLKGGYAGVNVLDPNARDVELYPTILSGDLNGNDSNDIAASYLLNNTERADNSYHVVYGSDVDANSILDGFIITGGNANGQSEPNNCGGGMFIDSNSSPTITNCVFCKNAARKNGGGIYNTAQTTLSNCLFKKNNAYSGGGIANDGDYSQIIKGCIFEDNVVLWNGSGMWNSNGSATFAVNCIFRGNVCQAGGGGGLYNSGIEMTLANCIFSGNSAHDGGGIMVQGDFNKIDMTITSSTFYANTAYRGGAIYCQLNTNVLITNCILWGSSATIGNEIALWCYESGISVIISNSDIQGEYSGIGFDPYRTEACILVYPGDINADPMFIDADGIDNIPGTEDDNLQLSAGSTCIDAGSNFYVPSDTADIDNDCNTTELLPLDLNGVPRFIDDPSTTDTGEGILPIVDIGAYEFDATTPNEPTTGEITLKDYNQYQIGDLDILRVSLQATLEQAAPSGACITEVRCSFIVQSLSWDGTNFYCSDYFIWFGDYWGGDVVWNNLGDDTDNGCDWDVEDDGDIFINWFETLSFNGQDPNREWWICFQDVISGNTGYVSEIKLQIFWSIPEISF
ncbi:MAG: hypothetical protein JXA96_11620 [Sedimentisphaerales bacterium]|nr:hypothetical protein [Sedimentisphaerales bacterium]